MKKLYMMAATGVTSVAFAASVVSPAFAWHPEGKIVKSVQNVTTGSALSDANDAKTAVAAKPGDVLKYTITVTNPAAAASKQYNDLAFVVVKDTLPTGVELASDASKRQITENLGTILPGKSVTKEYTVKVTAKTNSVIENKACFTGDSVVKDNPKSGCDTAVIKVTVPPTPVPSPTPVTPTPEPQPEAPVQMPTELPQTGPASILMLGTIVSTVGYAITVLRLKFRSNW